MVKLSVWLISQAWFPTQGLADTFILLGMAFDSDEATQLNKEIFECVYYAALDQSNLLAQVEGEPLPLASQLY